MLTAVPKVQSFGYNIVNLYQELMFEKDLFKLYIRVFSYMYVYTLCACLVPTEASGDCQIP